jgi:competence protein ComEC
MLPNAYARPLIPCLLGLICGIAAGLQLPHLPGLLLGLCGVFLGALFLVWKKRTVYLLPLILFFLLGCWSLQERISTNLSPLHVTRFIDGDPWHIVGILRDIPELFPERTRFNLKVESLTRRKIARPVTGTIRVTVKGNLPDLRAGDRIACLAELKEIRNFNNPGGFDYQRHMALRGIAASAYVSNQELVVRLHAGASGWLRHGLNVSRRAVFELIERASHGEARPILKALVIGDRSGISQKNREAFSRIGIAHLLAISGLHIGMVASLAFLAFRHLLGRSERLLLAAWVTRGSALLSVFPVIAYGFLAGMSPATQRAVIMVTVFLIALFFEREHDSMNTLAVAAMVILIWSPTALFEISFQLSFVAVFAILYALKNIPFISKLRMGPPKKTKRLALFVTVSAAAILGTLPVSLYYFNQTSLIGIFTNCLMVPLVGFLVVPLSLLAALLLPLLPAGALWMMRGAAFFMEGGLFLARHLSAWPLAAVKTVTPTFFEIVLYYVLAWSLINLGRTRAAKAILVGAVLLSVTDAAYWAARRFGSRELRVTYVDVGQGNAALLELPGGPCMLIDGGGFYNNRFDVGGRIVAPFLWKKKIATVETLVLSHPDPDHLNGLLYIAEHFHVQEVWMTQDETASPIYKDFLRILIEKGITIPGIRDLLEPRTIRGVRFEILYPPSDFLKRKKLEGWRTTNNNSLVLKVSIGDISFLFPGDIEAHAEKELTALAGSKLKSHVLLVPHHGSKTSSTWGFLRRVEPAIAVVSSGWKHIFGLPCREILKRYEAKGCPVFRTDLSGAIAMTTGGRDLKVQAFLPHNSPRLPPPPFGIRQWSAK